MLRLAPFISILIYLSCPALAAQGDDYCAKDGAAVILLLDTTTPYDEADKAEIIEVVDEVYKILKGGDKLIVRTITDSYAHSERLLDRCMPYCNAASAIGRYWQCNDGMIRSDTDTLKAEMVRTLRERLSHFEELRYSDIIRTLVTMANEEVRGVQSARLIIFSDMIENSNNLSGAQLLNTPADSLLKVLKKERLIADLAGVDVQVVGVGRTGTADRRPLTVRELNSLDEFWRDYFAAAGATVQIGQHLVRGPQ